MPQFDPKAKKSPEAIPAELEGLSPDELNKLKRDVLRKSVDEKKDAGELAKELKDLAPVAAALIIGILLESLKEEAPEEQLEDKTKAVLSAVPVKERKIGTEAKPEKKEEPAKPKAVVRSPEIQNASDIVVIGDSIPKGMISRFERGKRPDFIGEVGRSTPAILSDVRSNREKLEGKKTAIISCGGNDMVWTDDCEKVANRIDSMVKECEKAGIEEIIVLTRFPYQADFERPYLKERSRELRKVILEKFRPPRVRVVDLYKHFVDEKGNLKQKYASKGKDKLHPSKAYKDALKIISRESGADLESLIG